MGISYLSAPIKPGVIPEQIPIELVSQVATQKQNKYDQALESIFAQYTNLLNLDTSDNNEITQKYYGMMKEADKNLTSLAKLDFLNPENAQKVEGIFNPILEDEDIMEAVKGTKEAQSAKATMDYWKKNKPDLYYSKNEEFNLIKQSENKLMSAKDYKEKRNIITARPFFDMQKDFIEQVKALPITKTITETPNGYQILTTSEEVLSEQQIMKFLNLDARHYSQGEVNSFFEYRQTTGPEIASSFLSRYDVAIKQTKDVITTLNTSIDVIKGNLESIKSQKDSELLSAKQIETFSKLYNQEIPVGTTVGKIREREKMKLETRELALKTNNESITSLKEERTSFLKGINAFEETGSDGNPVLKFNTPLEGKLLDNLKQQEYMSSLKAKIAKGLAVNNFTVSSKKDDVNFEMLQQENRKDLKLFETALKIYESNETGVTTNSDGTTTTKAPKDPTIMGTTDSYEVKEYDKQQFDTEKVRLSKAIADVEEKTYETEVTEGDYSSISFGNIPKTIKENGKDIPNPERQKIKDNAKKKMDKVSYGYEDFVTGKDVIKVGATKDDTMTREDFLKNYSTQIGLYETTLNNKASLDLMNQIEESIQKTQPKIFSSKEFSNKTKNGDWSNSNNSFIIYKDNNTVETQNNTPTTLEILLPTDMINGKNELDIKKLYNFNIAKGNNLRFANESKTPTFQEFLKLINNSNVYSPNGNRKEKIMEKFPDNFTPLNDQYKLFSQTQKTPLVQISSGDIFDKLKTLGATQTSVDGKIKQIDITTIQTLGIFENPETKLLQLQVGFKDPKLKDAENISTKVITLTPEARKKLGPQFQEYNKVFEINNAVDIIMREKIARDSPAYINTDIDQKPETIVQYNGIKYIITASDQPGMLDFKEVKREGVDAKKLETIPASKFAAYVIDRNNQGKKSLSMILIDLKEAMGR
jgi:hypothetical protein